MNIFFYQYILLLFCYHCLFDHFLILIPLKSTIALYQNIGISILNLIINFNRTRLFKNAKSTKNEQRSAKIIHTPTFFSYYHDLIMLIILNI